MPAGKTLGLALWRQEVGLISSSSLFMGQFQLDILNLAAVVTIKHYILNRLQLWAEGTQNAATTPSRQRYMPLK